MTNLTPEARAQQRARYLSGLMWHIGVFVIINSFFWILDLTVGADGLDWAYWITIFWGLAVAFHALAWYVDGRQLETRKAQEYLAEERNKADVS
jgi:uncharacterized membrane protein YhaH (DUF805 family)